MLLNSSRVAALLGVGGFSSSAKLAASFATSSNASLLARLRKQTGHTFGFCREALSACNGDFDAACRWLDAEALKRGMEKADKLKNRTMSQGLLGLISTPFCVAACEVNCETDFVARNKEFQSLVASATESVHAYRIRANESGTHRMNQESLASLPVASSSTKSKSLSELLASTVGAVGENMAISRAVAMNLTESGEFAGGSRLIAYCHKSNAGVMHGVRGVQFGKYVSILRYRPTMTKGFSSAKDWELNAYKVASQLCQHIVGMNPLPGLLELSPVPGATPDDERCLFRQKFLLDESLTVDSLLKRHEMQLEDFVRLECGSEEEPPTEKAPSDTADAPS